MAQYSMNAYDADVYIPGFVGLMQGGDPLGGDLRYASELLNVETPDGVLQPVPMMSGPKLMLGDSAISQTNGTLMFLKDESAGTLHKVNMGGVDPTHQYAQNVGTRDSYLIIYSNKLYKLEMVGVPKETGTYTLTAVTMPSGVSSFTNSECDWTTYEIDVQNPQVPSQTLTINALVLANKNGLFYYADGAITKVSLPTGFPSVFNCVARYAERIWIAYKDTVYYSRPYSITDWTQDNDNPENGGGEIRLATFDSDEIIGMKTMGESLIMFSKKRAWKLTGSDPSNFIIQEQYGNGCLFPKTAVTMNNSIIMMGEDGLVIYDGYQVQPFLREQTQELLRNIKNPYANMKATKIGSQYLLSFSGEVSRATGTRMDRPFNINEQGYLGTPPDALEPVTIDMRTGYKMMIYDTETGGVTIRNTPPIISFCGGQPFCLTRVAANNNQLVRIKKDSWYLHDATNQATKWVSPWITLGRQDIKKGGFELYFTPEIEAPHVVSHQYWETDNTMGDYPVYQYAADPSEYSVTFKISIETEKKTKTKNYTVYNLSAADISAGKKYKPKRLHFGGSGRRFRVIIETAAISSSSTPVPWRLVGGIHIIAETDKD